MVHVICSVALIATSSLLAYLAYLINQKNKLIDDLKRDLFKQSEKLKQELNKPKSQEFINFLTDFNRGGAVLHIEPISQNNIYFHNSEN